MIILGLTGSIGMGKSEAAKAFAGLGVPVFDSDAEVHRLLGAGGAIGDAIEAAFPGVTKDGGIDRGALGARVFGDAAALKRLEAILHPAVGLARREFITRCRGGGENLLVLDVPLLFETGGDAACDYVAVVSAPPEVQHARVMAREGVSEERFQEILAQQMPDAEKRKRADFVISTDRPLGDTATAIAALVDQLREENQAKDR